MATQPKTRIAPTPSGLLHIGNAFSFLITQLWAKKNGAKILLRIDDLDSERSRPAYIEDIFETLEWLGIEWQEGPNSPDDFMRNWSQRKRMAIETPLMTSLNAKIFACQCSRKDLEGHSIYPGICLHKGIPLNTPYTTLRIVVPENTVVEIAENIFALGKEIGSFIIRKRDGIPAYQLASLLDDVQFGITHIVRGEDLLPSTASQIYLAGQLALGGFAKCSFHHHPLLKNDSGEKLSKSKGADSLREMRLAGKGAEQLKDLAMEYFEQISR
ncbi:MAG: hypothetical protein EXR21_08105 [Flavobacteriaceae bacterium]|nr:hypothetical protein [Flavobacteriaceae bacterium]